MAMQKVVFQPNVPEQIALKYPAGRVVSGQYGEQLYFTTSDNRALYLDLHVGQAVHDLGPRPGEPILITKQWSGKRGDPVNWEVALASSRTGEQGDGTFAVPTATSAHSHLPRGTGAPAAAAAATPSRLAATTHDQGNSNTNGGSGTPPRNGTGVPNAEALEVWAQHLLSVGRQLTAVYAAALQNANALYPGLVRNDDVKSFVITAYIQQTKSGGPSVY